MKIVFLISQGLLLRVGEVNLEFQKSTPRDKYLGPDELMATQNLKLDLLLKRYLNSLAFNWFFLVTTKKYHKAKETEILIKYVKAKKN